MTTVPLRSDSRIRSVGVFNTAISLSLTHCDDGAGTALVDENVQPLA